MSAELLFLPEAKAELECVTGDYEAVSPGLGRKFRQEVELSCLAILRNPLQWRLRPEGYRRVNLAEFPYYLVFQEDGNAVVILALAHTSRSPGYFQNRLL